MASIQLSKLESQISQLLLSVAKDLKSQKNKQVTLRIAGGWVRDKLLGIDSKDLDIALDTMTGYEFAKEVELFLFRQGEKSPHVAKIESNPDKSKHLETATMKLYGLFVDFVNLRTEVYQDHSRVPEMQFGSPLEDALRRDITINSLFYNIHIEKVEDFTEKGLKDLKNKIVRTPLPPLQTFIDDPLRVLRVIRFASRLDYHIAQEIFDAVKNNKQIHDAFGSKISRERVGVEIEKMLMGPSPLRSLRLIKDFEFYDVVFGMPELYEEQHIEYHFPNNKILSHEKSFKQLENNQITSRITDEEIRSQEAVQVARAVDWLLSQSSFNQCLPKIVDFNEPSQKKVLYLAAALIPYRSMTYLDKKQKQQSVIKTIILNILKLSSNDADYVHGIVQNAEDMIHSISNKHSSRKEAGLYVRKLGSKPMGPYWVYTSIIAAAKEVAPYLDPSPEEQEGHGHAALHNNGNKVSLKTQETVSEILSKYIHFYEYVTKENLHESFLTRPLLDGREVAQIFNVKPGPIVGKILERIMEWQLENPIATKQDCELWIQSQDYLNNLDVLGLTSQDIEIVNPDNKRRKKE